MVLDAGRANSARMDTRAAEAATLSSPAN